MQSAQAPQPEDAPLVVGVAGKVPNYRLRVLIVFFIWFLLIGEVTFVRFGGGEIRLDFAGYFKDFFASGPDFIHTFHMALSVIFPLLYAVGLVFLCTLLSERALGGWLFALGLIHWLLYALGPVIAITFNTSPGVFNEHVFGVSGAADRWRLTIPYWASLFLLMYFVTAVFAVYIRRRTAERGLLIALKSAVMIGALFFVPFWPVDGGYKSLWTRIMTGDSTILSLALMLLPLGGAALALLSLTGLRRRRFLATLAGGVLFAYVFLPLWVAWLDKVTRVNWATLRANEIPGVIVEQLAQVVWTTRYFNWLSVPGYILPSIFLVGVGAFLYSVGRGKKPLVYAGTPAA